MDINFIYVFVCIMAGIGAGLSTGLVGLSAAVVIAPMLTTFLEIDSYEAIAIALASDVLASGASAIVYAKKGNIDIKNGLVLMISVLIFTFVGSFVGNLLPHKALGTISVFWTLLLGVKFIIKPVDKTRESSMEKTKDKSMYWKSAICGIFIGFICGFVGAGGGMMLLLVLTIILSYDLKRAVGTSVFIMTFAALFSAGEHIIIAQGIVNWIALIICVITTLVFAFITSLFANKVSTKKLNLTTGICLTVLGIAMIIVWAINL